MFEENEISVNAFGGTELSKRSLAEKFTKEESEDFQVIASRVRDLEESKIRIYWIHDLPEDSELMHLKQSSQRDKFHKFVFVSHWQKDQFVDKLGVPANDKIAVIENPIEPFPKISKNFDGKINLVYFSTPHRGLDILVPVFEELAKQYDNIHLHVYSSFKIYGWPDADKQFEPLFDRIRAHPQMTYHGFVKNEELRKSLAEDMHILAYPNTWKETSCRVLIESMSAGLFCVHPNNAALSETSASLTSMYQMNENKSEHAEEFYSALEHAINVVATPECQNYLTIPKLYADLRFNSNTISDKWKVMTSKLKEKYPTVSSRNIARQYFRYKV